MLGLYKFDIKMRFHKDRSKKINKYTYNMPIIRSSTNSFNMVSSRLKILHLNIFYRPYHTNTSISSSSSIIIHQKKYMQTITKNNNKERVLILGSGWAGFRLMRDLNKEKYDITVVSPRNHFVFTPLLPGTTVGSLEFRCVTEPIRSYSHLINYHQAVCDNIDFENKVIHCTNQIDDKKGPSFTLDYDTLIISVGAYSNTFGIPGVKQHACFLKDVNDAQKIRKKLMECFENASRKSTTDSQKKHHLHFAIIGGGPTGIEFAGELYDFISDDMSRLYPQLMPFVQITLYDVAPQILSSFDSQLSSYAHKQFDRKGINIKTKRYVKEVLENKLIIKDEGEVKFGLLVWATGNSPVTMVSKLNVSKDDQNQRILTNSYLQVIDENKNAYSNVYAVGDCSVIENNNLPATAQVATQKAIYLSQVLNQKKMIGKSTPDIFKFKNRGMMVNLGTSEALLDMSPVHKNAKNSGRLAWLLWKSAYFSMSMSIRNKLLIPYYW
ncbi:unnamed protein product [Cunninghamella blakesleeana]